ncbi:GNAT family N-acetyltransferase [Oceanobacillus profundus]|uniref:GNAT family N-acetyltransferase n=1 Tax=Oceanobacillus profundus TaxID=372463 RepID=UPI001F00D297|nr:GNAT family N-acetyltransferase [Oceanobacillus profundus]
MVTIKRAEMVHVDGIARVCCEGCIETYKGIRSIANIERNNQRFYNHERISKEIGESPGWDGYIVALDHNAVVGAIGGGMLHNEESEVYVLYLDPNRRGEGIGTKLLDFLTTIQREKVLRSNGFLYKKEIGKVFHFTREEGFVKYPNSWHIRIRGMKITFH